jgi:Ca-activated chloride channel family protein
MLESWMLSLLENVFQLEDIQFAWPEALWLMWLWPVLIGLSLLLNPVDDLSELQSESQLRVKHALIHKMERTASIGQVGRAGFSGIKFGLNLLRGAIILSLAVALAQPEKTQILEPLPQQKTVRDVVFVIESSASFLLPDYQVNGQPETRMNVVKTVLDQFISGLEGNRFGLTIYAEKAYTLMPLTADQTAARLNLKRLKPYLAGRTDTAMGEALGLALKQTDSQLNRGDSAESESLKRVIVLISDGQSKASRLPLSEAINYAQMMQVPIYTIGVGANSAQADKRIYTGLLFEPLESKSLQTIAAQTKAQYYQIGSGDELGQVLQKINAAEGVPFISPPRPPHKNPLYYLPLTVTVVSLFLYLFLSMWLMPLVGGRKVSKNALQNSEKAVTEEIH